MHTWDPLELISTLPTSFVSSMLVIISIGVRLLYLCVLCLFGFEGGF